MRKKDIVIKISDQDYYLLVVNGNIALFTDSYKNYDIIYFHELANYFYFDVDSCSDQKINIFACKQLSLRKIANSNFQVGDSLTVFSTDISLADTNTFNRLATQGVDVRTSCRFLYLWSHQRRNDKLIAYFKNLYEGDSGTALQAQKGEIDQTVTSIKELFISNFKEAVIGSYPTNYEDQQLTMEQRQSLICFLIELICKKDTPPSTSESIIKDLITSIKKFDLSFKNPQAMIDSIIKAIRDEKIPPSVRTGASQILVELFRCRLEQKQRQSIIDFMMEMVRGNE